MPRIFISYRRDDSKAYSGRLYDYLVDAFGKDSIFMDVDDIPPGVDFRAYLQAEIRKADVVLIVIGTRWAEILRKRRRNKNDFVRIELESALEQRKITVPVLVGGAGMPSPRDLPPRVDHVFPYLNASNIRDNPDFRRDATRLINQLKHWEDLPIPPELPPAEDTSSQRPPVTMIVTGLLVVFAVMMLAFVLLSGNNGDDGGDNGASNGDVTEQAVAQATDDVTEAPLPTNTVEPSPTDEPVATNTPLPTATATAMLTGTPTPNATATLLVFEPQRNDDWTPVERNFDGVPMVLVPAGCFDMGSENGDSDEQPIHEICFDEPFWIDKYEVTNEQYSSIGCSDWSSEPDQPRNCLDWFEASDYCEARSARLPTEAEWEYAARGPDRLIFPWGNEFDGTLANHCDSNCDLSWASDFDDGFENTASVGSFPNGASWVGAMDMSGNVWEWTSSLYADYPYDEADGREDADNRSYVRVIRGGSFYFSSASLRAAYRYWNNPDLTNSTIGFRCVRPPSLTQP